MLKQLNIFGVGVKTKDLYQTAIGVSTTYRERGEGRGGLHIRYKSYGQYICRRPNSEEAHYTKKEIAYILGDQ